jgi:hypothetical protein
LDASGNWIWNVTITPTASGTPLAAELGFRETVTGAQLLSAAKNAATWDNDNPGTQIFNWETLVDVNPDPGVTNMRPVGVQTNCAAGCTVNNSLDEVFSALGSIDLTAGTAVQYLTITTAGPTVANPTSTLAVLGKYGTGGTNGRIAEITGTTATNYSNFTGSATRTAFAGDANLSGGVTGADLATLASNFGKAGNFNWGHGDFNGSTGGTGEISGADLATLAANFGKSGGVSTPLTVNGVAGGAGAGLDGGSAVPEPASIALCGLAVLAGLGFTMRKRQK